MYAVRELESFELDDASPPTLQTSDGISADPHKVTTLPQEKATVTKDQANILYKLKDFPAATERYRKAITELIGPAPVGAGCEILVKRANDSSKEEPSMRAAVVLCGEEVTIPNPITQV